MAAKRRSIVEFEKWLDKEIRQAEVDVLTLHEQVEQLSHDERDASMKLVTLQVVRDRLDKVQTPDEIAEQEADAAQPNGRGLLDESV